MNQTNIPKNIDPESLARIKAKYGDQIEDIFPLSPGQTWMLGRTKQITGDFFLQTVIKFVMPMDPKSFEKRLQEAVRKRPSMRTAFVWRGLKTPYQVVLKDRRAEVRFIDRSDRTMEELSEEIDSFCREDRSRGFDLEEDPLFRVTLFSTAEENTSAVILSRPHLIEDGASQILMLKELFVDYLLKGKIRLPDLSKVSYGKYAKWLENRDQEKDLSYWRELLGEGNLTALPWRSPSEKEPEMRIQTLQFTEEENKTIRSLPNRYKATLNSILHAAWGILLAGYTGKKDILFGTVTSGRSREVAGIDRMTGCFMNAFPVRAEINGEESFDSLSKRLQSQILTSQEYAYLSPDELGSRLGKEEGFFDHLLNFQNYPGIPASAYSGKMLPGFTILDVESYDNLSEGFCLYFVVQDEKLSCRFCYDANCFSEEAISKLKDSYARVLRQILKDHDKSLTCGQIRVIETVSDIISLRTESDHPAFISGEEALSFRNLIKDAKQIADCLIGSGLRKGDRILLKTRSSLNTVRAIYGILLSGCVYVSADATWPEERYRLIEEEAGTKMRMTDEIIVEFLQKQSLAHALPVIREEDEAAVFYTSGSTGIPKGTVLFHKILMAYTQPGDYLEEFMTRDRFLMFPVFATVHAAIVMFVTAAYEKTVVITTLQELQGPDLLTDCIVRNHVEGVGATPSLLLRCLMYPPFAQAVRQQVTLLYVGGELMTEEMAQTLFSSMTDGVLDIVYGSTEAFICSVYSYRPGESIHLEHAPLGTFLYVAGENGDPVSDGETGEILIGGAPAKYGHYLSTALNEKKYMEHPAFGRLFRIGDAGRLDRDGSIIVTGRVDRMIKLHGLRIEPGEVEETIGKFDGIRRTAVCLKNGQLCAYYTADKEVEETALRRYLSEHLPYYMIPSRLLCLDALPVSQSGKLDYSALPDPKDAGKEGSLPVNRKEEMLCRIFQEVLDLDTPVDVEESFFSLGGDSIHALKCVALLEREGYQMELKDLFTAPTARLLAPLLTERAESVAADGFAMEVPEEVRSALQSAVDLNEVEAVYPVSAFVEDYLKKNKGTYPQVYCFEISSDISSEQLEKTAQELGEKHTALRSLVLPAGEKFFQVVLKTPRTQFFQTDLSALSEGEGLSEKQKAYLSSLIRMEYSPMTELGNKTLLRVGRIRMSLDKAILYIGCSHLTMEGSSVYQIFHELTGQAEPEADAELLKQHFGKLFCADRSAVSAYWSQLLNGCGKYTELPVQAKQTGVEKREHFYAAGGRALYEKAVSFCRKRRVTISALLSFCLGRSLMELLSVDEVCFPVAGSGRSASEMNLPGMFVVFFPLRLTRHDTVFTCQEQLLRSAGHAWVFADPEFPQPEGRPVFLSAQNYYTGTHTEEERHLSHMEILGAKQASALLDRYPVSGGNTVGIIAETEGQLAWHILSDGNLYEAGQIRQLSAEWIRQLKACVGSDDEDSESYTV